MPVLLGDLLISSSNRPPAFELPVLTDDVVQYLSSGASDHPIRLDQKIYILKENVCIAFAGDVADIKKFLIDIRIYCKAKEEITTMDMQYFLQQHVGSDTWREISFVILVADRLTHEIGIGKFLHGQWLRADTELYGEVWATGSGAEDFLIEASVKMDFFGTYKPEDAEHAIQANLIMICRLLAQERKTLNSVKNHWGAGFEMIYYDGRQFKKVDEITYVINYGNYTDTGDIPQVPIPAIILHYKYFEELLVISVIRAFSGNTIENDTTYTIKSDDILKRQFVVAPFDYTGDEDFSKLGEDYSFTSNINIMSYILETEGYYYIPASINLGKELEVQFIHPNSVIVTMLKPINDRLREKVKNILSQSK